MIESDNERNPFREFQKISIFVEHLFIEILKQYASFSST